MAAGPEAAAAAAAATGAGEDGGAGKSLRQLSYWFGEGATARLGGAVLRVCSDGDHEHETFAALRRAEASRAHLVFLVDCTGSMGDFINSMPSTLTQVFSVLNVLFGDSAEVSVVAYEDYSDGEKKVLRKCVGRSREATLAFARRLKAGGGGDIPEASKTALAAVLKVVRASATPGAQTLVFHYTDAAPHHPANFASASGSCNGRRERKLLTASSAPNHGAKQGEGKTPSTTRWQRWPPPASSAKNLLAGASGWMSTHAATAGNPGFDWVAICRAFRDLGVRVFSFTPRSYHKVEEAWPFLAMLGELVVLEHTAPKEISAATMDIVMQLMGQYDPGHASAAAAAAAAAGGGGAAAALDEGGGEHNTPPSSCVQLQFHPPLSDADLLALTEGDTVDRQHLLVGDPGDPFQVAAPGDHEASMARIHRFLLSGGFEPAPHPCLAPPFSAVCNFSSTLCDRNWQDPLRPSFPRQLLGCGRRKGFVDPGFWFSTRVRAADGVGGQARDGDSVCFLCCECERRIAVVVRDYHHHRHHTAAADGDASAGGEAKRRVDTPDDDRAMVAFRAAHGLVRADSASMTACGRRLVWKSATVYDPVPFMARDLGQLPRRFKSDEAFRGVVFSAMHELLVPSNVMSLTSNAVLGTLWRLCAAQRDDKRLEGLAGALSTCLSSKELTPADQRALRIWIEDSYNYADEINEAIIDAVAAAASKDCSAAEVADDSGGDGGAGGESKAGESKAGESKAGADILSADGGYLILDDIRRSDIPTVALLRSLARVPAPGVLASVQHVLSSLLVVGNSRLPVDAEGNRLYLPLSGMDDYSIFSFLPHLLHPGTKFSLKPAALLAILVLRSSQGADIGRHPLASRARRFLLSVRGKWLPPVHKIDRPEILSYEFATFLSGCAPHPGVLTNKEKEFFDRLALVWRLRRARGLRFDLTCPRKPLVTELTPDRKESCRKCKRFTSLTLLDATGQCGLCHWESLSTKNRWQRPGKGSAYYCESRKHSYLTECSACACIYACVGVADLVACQSASKCHFCREEGSRLAKKHKHMRRAVAHEKKKKKKKTTKKKTNEKSSAAQKEDGGDAAGEVTVEPFRAPHRTCVKCKARWIRGVPPDDEAEAFVCPVCEDTPLKATASSRAALGEILAQNKHVMVALGFRRGAADLVLARGKFDLVGLVTGANRRTIFTPPSAEAVSRAAAQGLQLRRKPVLDDPAVLVAAVRERVLSASFEDCCSLCFDDLPLEKLGSPCGRKCECRCCHDCLRSWYEANQPGQLYLESKSVCPFCRMPPSHGVLRRYNPRLAGIEGRCKSGGLPNDVYHAWCLGCGKVAPAMPRECAGLEVPEITNFICETCREGHQAQLAAMVHRMFPGMDANRERAIQILREVEAMYARGDAAGRGETPYHRWVVEEARRRIATWADAEALERFMAASPEVIRACPKCHVRIEKASGCNHMTCTCGAHFCWQCGNEFATARETYNHLHDGGNSCSLWE